MLQSVFKELVLKGSQKSHSLRSNISHPMIISRICNQNYSTRQRSGEDNWTDQCHPKDWKESKYGGVVFDATMYELAPGENPGFGYTPDPIKCRLWQLHTQDPEYWTYERLSRKFGIKKERVAASITLKQHEKNMYKGKKIPEEQIALSNAIDDEYERMIEEASQHFKRDMSWRCPTDNKPEAGSEHLCKSYEVRFDELEQELKKHDITLTEKELQNIKAEMEDANIQGAEITFEIQGRDGKDGAELENKSTRNVGLDAVKAHFEYQGFEPDEASLVALQKAIDELGPDAEIEFEVDNLLIEPEDEEVNRKKEIQVRTLSDEENFYMLQSEAGKYKKKSKSLKVLSRPDFPDLKEIPTAFPRRSKFGFKDISKNEIPTVLIDKEGQPRYASEDEEENRSWVPKKDRLFHPRI